ncbi:uncharacterized protein [Bemisia tabaci]|uniref:uncharacterized protein isoform X1 n=1 Tax=Bemisia tabaci TaxID=7038 RepID=UPI003B286E67
MTHCRKNDRWLIFHPHALFLVLAILGSCLNGDLLFIFHAGVAESPFPTVPTRTAYSSPSHIPTSDSGEKSAVLSLLTGNIKAATSTTNESATTSNAVIEKNASPDPIVAYMNGVTGPLQEDDLEYSLDYYNEKFLMKEYEFEPADFLKRLAKSAMSEGTTPAQFLQEIQDLLSLQNRSRSEQDDAAGREDASKIPAGYLSESLRKKMTEGWKNELKRLEKKYNISSESAGPDSITSTRLSLLFPHYINFGQKPFAAPANITVGISFAQKQVYDSRRGTYYYETPDAYIPSILGRPEFGGVIPLVLLSKPTQRIIIGTHLYALHWQDGNDMVPFRTKCALLKRRMEKSSLSEERRFRFLINNEIMHKNGTLLRTSIKNVYEQIPSTFKEKIDWDLLSWEVHL